MSIIYSQHEEQQIIEEIIEEFDIENTALEIGINTGARGDGSVLQGNTVFLKNKGWRCVWLDAHTRHPDVSTISIYPENILETVEREFADAVIGIFSIDIDSEDWHVARALLDSDRRPEVFVCETNSYLDPADDLVMPLGHRRRGRAKSICHGATLTAFDRLLRGAGYNFYCSNRLGTNGFWIHGGKLSQGKDIKSFFSHRHPCTTNWSKSSPSDRWTDSKTLLG